MTDQAHPPSRPTPTLLASPGRRVTDLSNWRSEADTRIEHIRKRDVQITVTAAGGAPLPGVPVTVRQIRKAFPFGAGMSRVLLTNARFREFFRSHFTWAVFGNEAKWYANEAVRGCATYADADAMLDWCRLNGIAVRGHCVFWEPEKWQPNWVRGLSGRELRDAVERRLESAVSHFRGRFEHWDVNNEMLHGSFFRDRLGDRIWPTMFVRTRELDPKVRLFVNDFNVLSVDQDFTAVETDDYVAHIRTLLDHGAPITDIGIQGHVWNEDILATPYVLQDRLDRVAALGLPIWITEFDTAHPDENVRADQLELVYRTAYSHPAVAGIVMWVVWAGDSWRGPDAGIVNLDWSLNAAGQRFESLMREWTTEASGVTDELGQFRFRGYPGRYQVDLNAMRTTPISDDFTLEPGIGQQKIPLQYQACVV